MRSFARTGLAAAIMLGGVTVASFAMAQTQTATPPPTSAGPGRIICKSATKCELGIGSPASLKYKIDASSLADADKDRLVKQCTSKGAPCVATVTGIESKGVVKASTITFYN